MPTNDAKLSLRLPTSLRDALEQMADKDRRSVNAQILVLLERAVEEEKMLGVEHQAKA